MVVDNDVEVCLLQPELCPHDYEQINSLYLRIGVEDEGEPPASSKFWIQVHLLDENDPPIDLELDQNTVAEKSPIGTLIGELSVRDQDRGQVHTYEIIDEDPKSPLGNLFMIDGNNLRLARVPDFEQGQFVVVNIRATDNGTIPKSVSSVSLHNFDENHWKFCISEEKL